MPKRFRQTSFAYLWAVFVTTAGFGVDVMDWSSNIVGLILLGVAGISLLAIVLMVFIGTPEERMDRRQLALWAHNASPQRPPSNLVQALGVIVSHKWVRVGFFAFVVAVHMTLTGIGIFGDRAGLVALSFAIVILLATTGGAFEACFNPEVRRNTPNTRAWRFGSWVGRMLRFGRQ